MVVRRTALFLTLALQSLHGVNHVSHATFGTEKKLHVLLVQLDNLLVPSGPPGPLGFYHLIEALLQLAERARKMPSLNAKGFLGHGHSAAAANLLTLSSLL